MTSIFKKTYSVSELNGIARSILEAELSGIWLEGEISNLAQPASGHIYFSLKDSKAQIRCAMFRNRSRFLKFRPAAGAMIRVLGKISLYEPRGDYQMIVDTMEPAGEGALQQAFEQLKEKLWKAGLFDEKNKKALPLSPTTVGIITSPTGAAIQDILQVLRRRFPLMEVVIYPVQVQGHNAAGQIVAAIQAANARKETELLMVTRGGGSLEDLWPFNEEEVALAIHDSRLPVISAIGHEIDFTIADFVADARAPTPSAAAEMISPDRENLLTDISDIRSTISTLVVTSVQNNKSEVDTLQKRLERCSPQALLERQTQTLDELEGRLMRHMERLLEFSGQRILVTRNALLGHHPGHQITLGREKLTHQTRHLLKQIQESLIIRRNGTKNLAAELALLNPENVLGRGYAIVSRETSGQIVSNAAELRKGEKIRIRFRDSSRQGEIID